MHVSPAVPLPGKIDRRIDQCNNASFIIPGHLQLEVDQLEVGANHDEIITDCSLEAEWTLRSEAVEGHSHERRHDGIKTISQDIIYPRQISESWDILGYPDPGINRDYPDLHLCCSNNRSKSGIFGLW